MTRSLRSHFGCEPSEGPPTLKPVSAKLVSRCPCALRWRTRLARLFAALLFSLLPVLAFAKVDLPTPDIELPIKVSAQRSTHWVQGSFDVWALSGDCAIEQGLSTAKADEVVLWVLREDDDDGQRTRVIAYLEGHVDCQ